MRDLRNNNFSNEVTADGQSNSQAVVKSFLSNVFTYMAGALAITGVLAYWFSSSPALMSNLINYETGSMTILGYIVMFAPLAFVLVMSFSFNKLSSFNAHSLS